MDDSPDPIITTSTTNQEQPIYPGLKRIPGNHLEGGGQVLRIALALSALTCSPVFISNIRGGRPRGGGLKEQHLTAVTWLARICNAHVEGVNKGSKEVLFVPQTSRRNVETSSSVTESDIKPWWNETQLDDGRIVRLVNVTMSGVGAISLVLQALLPVLIFTPTRTTSGNDEEAMTQVPYLLRITGGTNVSFAPSTDYVSQVLFPNLVHIGFKAIELLQSTLKRGWAGGRADPGVAEFIITPFGHGESIPAFEMRSILLSDIVKWNITIVASGLLSQLLRNRLISDFTERGRSIGMLRDEESGQNNRAYVLLVGESLHGIRLGTDVLYTGKLKSGRESTVVDDMMKHLHSGISPWTNNAVDQYMRDQLILYQGLATGTSVVECEGPGSLHTQTAKWLVEEMLCADDVTNDRIKGIAFKAKCKQESAADASVDEITENMIDISIKK